MESLPITPSAAHDLLLLLWECRRRGIRVSSDGHGLRLSGPVYALTTRLREGLRTHRAYLVALLGGAGERSLPDRPEPDERGGPVREPIPGSSARSSSTQVVVTTRGIDVPWHSPGERFPDLPDFPDENKRVFAHQESIPPSGPTRRARSYALPLQEQPPVVRNPGNPGASPLVLDTSGLTCSRTPRGDAGAPRWVPGEPLLLLEDAPPDGPGWCVAPAPAGDTAAPRSANRVDSGKSRRGAQAPQPAPWLATVARWSIPWRQRWGDRANALQEAGLTGFEAEHRAFNEVVLLRAMRSEVNSDEDEATGRGDAGSCFRSSGGPASGRGGRDPGVAGGDGTERRDAVLFSAEARQQILPLIGAS
jgi:hypothetical protein